MEDTTKNPSAQPVPTIPSVGSGSKEFGATAQIEEIGVEEVDESPTIPTEVSEFVKESQPSAPSPSEIGLQPPRDLANPEQNSAKLHMSEAEIEEVLKQGVGKQIKVDELQKDFTEKIYFVESRFFLARLLRKISDRAKQILKPGVLIPKQA